MSRAFQLFCLCTMLLTLAACETVLIQPEVQPQRYFPASEGMVREYRVDTIHYRETLGSDTQRWYVRQVLGPEMLDLEGQTTYTVEVYRRRQPADNWQYHRTDLIRLSDQRAEYVENNLRFIKLVFPMVQGLRWNGHAFLSDLSSVPVTESCNNYQFLEGWQFHYTELDQFVLFDGIPLDSTVLVTQTGEQNLIEFNQSSERYAAGIGLIWRRFEHLTTQTICPECPWTEKAECGFAVEQWLQSSE